jgi:cysteine desulfurase / selenocysteine lyase
MFNVAEVRKLFPALSQKIRDQQLVYLDSAATSLKPQAVIDRICSFYSYEASNVHRGAHYLSDQATRHFEEARQAAAKFLGAAHAEEIIFTRGTTEGVNLVASTFGETSINAGDEIVLTELEHHSNLVPWQNLANRKGAKLRFIPVLATGELDITNLSTLITSKTKIVAVSGCSNILGTFPPIQTIIHRAKEVGAKSFVDAAQLVSQKVIDVQRMGCDFLAFSGHKLFGPFGFGVLYGRKEVLQSMPPYQFGGSMISEVRFAESSYNEAPYKFEAGTPHVEGAIGTHAAINFFSQYDLGEVRAHEDTLLKKARHGLAALGGVNFFGDLRESAAILSFNLEGAHHSDVGQILDQMGVAVRVGHHCTQPLLKKFGMTGTVRASFSIYNTEDDVEALIAGVRKARSILL